MSEKILYFECKTGAAGDMVMGALYELLSEAQQREFLEKINSISDQISVSAQKVTKKGIGGTHMKVMANGCEEGIDEYHHHDHEGCDQHDHHDHHHDHHSDYHDHNHSHSHGDTDKQHMHHVHTHCHTSYKEVLNRIEKVDFSDAIKKNASDIYMLIGQAESKVHGTEIDQIHFHEIGTLDAFVDVMGACIAVDMLGADRIISTPICVGNGTVRQIGRAHV